MKSSNAAHFLDAAIDAGVEQASAVHVDGNAQIVGCIATARSSSGDHTTPTAEVVRLFDALGARAGHMASAPCAADPRRHV
jgi:hypothetical protein